MDIEADETKVWHTHQDGSRTLTNLKDDTITYRNLEPGTSYRRSVQASAAGDSPPTGMVVSPRMLLVENPERVPTAAAVIRRPLVVM